MKNVNVALNGMRLMMLALWVGACRLKRIGILYLNLWVEKTGRGMCLSLQLVGAAGCVRNIIMMMAILVQTIHAVVALIIMGFL